MLSGLLKSRVAGGKKRDRRKNFSSLCGPKREKAITSEHSAAVKTFLFPEQIHNWMRSKQARWAWIIFEPIKTPCNGTSPRRSATSNKNKSTSSEITLPWQNTCNNSRILQFSAKLCLHCSSNDENKHRNRCKKSLGGLCWGISTCHCLWALYLHLKWAVNVFDTLWENFWASRPTEACVVSLNKVRSDSTNEIFKCSSCLDWLNGILKRERRQINSVCSTTVVASGFAITSESI